MVRASDAYQKQYILDRVFSVWFANPELRLGELLMNVFTDGLHDVEDYVLADNLETFYDK